MENKENQTEIVQETSENIDVQQSVESVDSKNEEVEKVVENKPKKVKKVKKEKQKDEVDSFEGLSDDEIYTKLQTEKLLKRKQNKKIATLVGLCFSFVLAVVIIVLAAVPVSLKPQCINGDFASVAIYPGKPDGTSFAEGEEGYDLFMKTYDKAFGQSYISAIFSGSLFQYDIEEKLEDVNKVIGTGGELYANNTYYARLRYSKEQTFTYRNGKQYVSNIGSTKRWPDGKLTFTDVYFVVNKESGFQNTEVYFVVNYPTFDDEGNKIGTKEKLITVTLKANTYEIYDNWQNLLDLAK